MENTEPNELENLNSLLVAELDANSAARFRIEQLERQLEEARKVIKVVDGLITAKGRYHTAQWYQKMVTAIDEYKATIKEQQ